MKEKRKRPNYTKEFKQDAVSYASPAIIPVFPQILAKTFSLYNISIKPFFRGIHFN
jgi:hypothetical protein